MGNKSDKLKEEALRRQNEQYQAQFQQQLQRWEPGPLEQAYNKEGMEWLDATSGKTPLDITKLPGMAPYLDIYNTAVAKQKGERTGLGTLRLGAASANPNLIAQLAQQDQSHRQQDAGAQLHNAFAIRNAEVRGSAMPLIGIGENRAGGRVSATAGAAQNSNSLWAQHQIRPGFWANMLNSAVQGAGAAAITKI